MASLVVTDLEGIPLEYKIYELTLNTKTESNNFNCNKIDYQSASSTDQVLSDQVDKMMYLMKGSLAPAQLTWSQ